MKGGTIKNYNGTKVINGRIAGKCGHVVTVIIILVNSSYFQMLFIFIFSYTHFKQVSAPITQTKIILVKKCH